jgi:hypothetical protein
MQDMKVIDLNEARTNLEQYALECQVSPVVVTVNGKPTFEMLPVRSDDADFMDRLIEENVAFAELLENRRREADLGHVSSLEEVRARLG